MAHTILLVQPGPKPETRTFSDYESVNECMEAGVCKIYEEHLKRMNPNTPSITYDISQLFDFIDQLADLSCLVYQKSTNTYAPYNKDWIKEKIYILLRRQAAKANWNLIQWEYNASIRDSRTARVNIWWRVNRWHCQKSNATYANLLKFV